MTSNAPSLSHPALEPTGTVVTSADGKTSAAAPRRPHLVLERSAGWRSLRLGDVWEFRDLVWTLGMRDVKLVYKQTLLGVAWVVLQPLIGAGIFTFVFGVLAKFDSGQTPYFVFSFVGMLGWTLFSATLSASSTVMVTNAHLVSKIYFPRLVLPLASAFQPFVNFVVSLAVMAALMLAYLIRPGWPILLLPVWAALLLMLALGAGFWLSSVMVSYRDLRYVVPVGVQFLLYASPVGYGVAQLNDRVPERWQAAYMLNPLASLLEGVRWSLLGEGLLDWRWMLYAVATTIAVFFAGAFAFRRAERGFADVI